MLSAEAPTEVTIAALQVCFPSLPLPPIPPPNLFYESTNLTKSQQIVNATHRLANNSIDNLSRWIRCLFSLALTTAPELAEHLLSQVVTIATGAKDVCSPISHPVLCPP